MQPASPRKHATVSSEHSTPANSPPPQPLQQPESSKQYPQAPSSHASQEPMYQQQPLKEAVSMAFDASDVSHQISPDLIKHITEQVISNLKFNNVGRGNVPQKRGSGPAPALSDSTPSIPPRDVYTPPSPNRDDLSKIRSFQAEMSDSQPDGKSSFEQMSTSERTGERLPPHKEDVQPSQAQSGGKTPTTLEKIWQPLFTDDGKPTARLGQFLRGLALHIVEDFEPRNSLVITPQKMMQFYEKVRLTEELYPWSDMFGGKMSNSSISHLYRDLECQHHFVQRQYDEKPNIPALTPQGFQCWMTHIIQAHPEEEFLRLAKATMDMPISNADDRRERFPKQLSRRLFPKQPNRSIRDLFEDSVLADPVIELPRNNPNGLSQSQASQPGSERHAASAPPQHQMPPQPSQAPPGYSHRPSQPPPPPQHLQAQQSQQSQPSQPQPQPQSYPPPQPHLQAHSQSHLPQHLTPDVPLSDRERKPFSAALSDASGEESKPIERERKPYCAQPGGGKVFEGDDLSRTSSRPEELTKVSSRPQRSNSVTGSRGTPGPPPLDDSAAQDRARARRSRAGSQSGPHPGVPRQPRRTRSPSINAQSNPYSRSEGDMPPPAFVNPAANRASYIHDDSDTELERNYSRNSRDERMRRRTADETSRNYPLQPKPIFDPPQYQRQSASDASSGYGPPNGYQYPPPPRYA